MKTRTGRLHCIGIEKYRVRVIFAKRGHPLVLVAGETWGGGWVRRADLRAFRPLPGGKR